MRPTNEQPTASGNSGGLLPSQGPAAPGGSSSESGFLSYLKSSRQADVASAGTRPDSQWEKQRRADASASRAQEERTAYESRESAARDTREAAERDRAQQKEAGSRAEDAYRERNERRDTSDKNNAGDSSKRSDSIDEKRAAAALKDEDAADSSPGEGASDKEAEAAAKSKKDDHETVAAKGENANRSGDQDARVKGEAAGDAKKLSAEQSGKAGIADSGVERSAAESTAFDSTAAELGANLKDLLLNKKGGAGESKAGPGADARISDKAGGGEQSQQGLAREGVTGKAQAGDAAELARFAERVAAAKAKLSGEESGQKASNQGGQGGQSGESQAGTKEAKIDAASGGLRVELDSAKWQLNGRVYGERAGNDNVETKVAGLMDRYIKGRGANSKDSGGNSKDSGGESGRDQRGDTRSFANRLSDLQIMNGGEARDANSQSSLDQARMQRDNQEIARENRRLFNDLVEKARVNVQSNGNSSASIKMNPAALGRMTLNLEVHQNQVHARILVDSDAAKRMLMDEMDHLRQELTRQGITVESLSIKVREPASMSFMEGSTSGENSGLEQQAAGDETTGDGAANEGRGDGEDQGLRATDQAGQEYDLAAGAAANAEAGARRELSAVNISI